MFFFFFFEHPPSKFYWYSSIESLAHRLAVIRSTRRVSRAGSLPSSAVHAGRKAHCSVGAEVNNDGTPCYRIDPRNALADSVR